VALPDDAQACCFVLTADRARARPFYEGVLGLKVLAVDDHAVTYDLGRGTPLRLTDHAGHVASAHTVLGWNVKDIRAAIADLAANGLRCNVYEGFGQDADGVWTAPGGAASVAWFNDPDGNVLSFTQFGA
jgi:catechol 2,3-dioxygenase-like lactoylglutathione lyase family enzyme